MQAQSGIARDCDGLLERQCRSKKAVHEQGSRSIRGLCAIPSADPAGRDRSRLLTGQNQGRRRAAVFFMEHPGFYERAGPFSLADIAKATHAELGARRRSRCRDRGRPRPLGCVRAPSLLPRQSQVPRSAAGHRMPPPASCSRRSPRVFRKRRRRLLTPEPYRGFALALRLFYPDALQPEGGERRVARCRSTRPPSWRRACCSSLAPSSDRDARIGRGTRVAAGAVVGYRVTIGRDCYIGPLTTVAHALIGDRVIIHSGARIGQDGFGFAMSPPRASEGAADRPRGDPGRRGDRRQHDDRSRSA